jgi:hypothetical protein
LVIILDRGDGQFLDQSALAVVLALAVVFALWMLLTRRGQQAASVTGVGVSTLRSGWDRHR